jgi:hypothetical protein
MTSPRLKAIEPLLSELSQEEIEELASELRERSAQSKYKPKPIDWDHFDGIIKNGPDPLEYQRAIRAEWDERGF